MKSKAVFLDRDGTINIDYGYVKSPEEVVIFDGVAQSLKKLKDKGFLLIVVTNQSGVARGYMTEQDVQKTNDYINSLIKKEASVEIDRFYYCPYHPDFSLPELSKCRKPSPLMVLQAVEDFNIDLSKSYFIGDTITDMQCANNANVNKSIMVKTSKYNELDKLKTVENIKIDFIADNFIQAVNYILKDISEEN
ncbi:MAG TPA: HAD family hydrolase [Ignavibacteriales bacterium]|nr:HAD family hydrolase [Ignavibacteriales bacterium]HOL81066.1 HAD family hydrolase [Ignavibacteriales bacterium]HPP32847.1 HAD family hydrolase [Ignavibacteriales bacterium]